MVPGRNKRPMYPNSVGTYLSVILVEAYLSVILSEVRRPPNGVEGPRRRMQ